jgi:hypothetical protein
MNLGAALKASGKLDEAIDCYQRAIEADPTFAQAHNNLANALKARGGFAAAVEHNELASSLDPTLAEPHYSLGLLLANQERDVVASPAALLDHANEHFCAIGLPSQGAFITAFSGALDTKAGQLTYSCACHPPPRLLRAADGAVAPVAGASSLPLAILDDRTRHVEATVELEPGDLLLFYSDGITDRSLGLVTVPPAHWVTAAPSRRTITARSLTPASDAPSVSPRAARHEIRHTKRRKATATTCSRLRPKARKPVSVPKILMSAFRS